METPENTRKVSQMETDTVMEEDTATETETETAATFLWAQATTLEHWQWQEKDAELDHLRDIVAEQVCGLVKGGDVLKVASAEEGDHVLAVLEQACALVQQAQGQESVLSKRCFSACWTPLRSCVRAGVVRWLADILQKVSHCVLPRIVDILRRVLQAAGEIRFAATLRIVDAQDVLLQEGVWLAQQPDVLDAAAAGLRTLHGSLASQETESREARQQHNMDQQHNIQPQTLHHAAAGCGVILCMLPFTVAAGEPGEPGGGDDPVCTAFERVGHGKLFDIGTTIVDMLWDVATVLSRWSVDLKGGADCSDDFTLWLEQLVQSASALVWQLSNVSDAVRGRLLFAGAVEAVVALLAALNQWLLQRSVLRFGPAFSDLHNALAHLMFTHQLWTSRVGNVPKGLNEDRTAVELIAVETASPTPLSPQSPSPDTTRPDSAFSLTSLTQSPSFSDTVDTATATAGGGWCAHSDGYDRSCTDGVQLPELFVSVPTVCELLVSSLRKHSAAMLTRQQIVGGCLCALALLQHNHDEALRALCDADVATFIAQALEMHSLRSASCDVHFWLCELLIVLRRVPPRACAPLSNLSFAPPDSMCETVISAGVVHRLAVAAAELAETLHLAQGIVLSAQERQQPLRPQLVYAHETAAALCSAVAGLTESAEVCVCALVIGLPLSLVDLCWTPYATLPGLRSLLNIAMRTPSQCGAPQELANLGVIAVATEARHCGLDASRACLQVATQLLGMLPAAGDDEDDAAVDDLDGGAGSGDACGAGPGAEGGAGRGDDGRDG